MNKRIMRLALGAVSAMMLAVPAAASAEFESLHMKPTPAKLDIAIAGQVTLRTSFGNLACAGSSTGTATPEAGGTTGTLQITFANCPAGPGFCTSSNPAEPSGNISTTSLPYHLVTLPGKSPGI